MRAWLAGGAALGLSIAFVGGLGIGLSAGKRAEYERQQVEIARLEKKLSLAADRAGKTTTELLARIDVLEERKVEIHTLALQMPADHGVCFFAPVVDELRDLSARISATRARILDPLPAVPLDAPAKPGGVDG